MYKVIWNFGIYYHCSQTYSLTQYFDFRNKIVLNILSFQNDGEDYEPTLQRLNNFDFGSHYQANVMQNNAYCGIAKDTNNRFLISLFNKSSNTHDELFIKQNIFGKYFLLQRGYKCQIIRW